VTRKYFGTDGIRGKVGAFPIIPDFVLRLGWALGQVLASQNKQNKVVIGKDTRISGYMFESALEAGLTAAGINIELVGPMPTPAIAYLARTFRAQAGIVISASHNPYHDNGIKIFSASGLKLPDETELLIERALDQEMSVVESAQIGRATRINDAQGRYIEFCKSTVNSEVNFKKLKIVLDCANGATYQVAPCVFRELGAEVVELAVDPDGLNINQACGATDLKMLKRIVQAERADLGIAFDGDGDRVMMVDHKGNIVDGDELLFIIVRQMLNNKQKVDGVVGTLMSNFGLELAFQELGLGFVRAKVGDRYVMSELQRLGWRIGGENSGHLVCLDKTTTGDGIISALQVLQAMFYSGRSLFDLKQGMKKLPQVLINVPVSKKPQDLNGDLQEAVKQAESKLKTTGRVLLRSSGTEPVVRVMVEGENDELVRNVAQELAEQVKVALA